MSGPGFRAGDVTAVVLPAADGAGPVAEVELHRPPANYFDADLLDGVVAGVAWAAAAGARAAVLCAEGRHFCAGLDFGATPTPDPAVLARLYRSAVDLVDAPVPVVAAVQGAAVGGGLGLALAADFRVAGRDARFAATFARLGFHQGFGLSVTLPAAVGNQRALELLTTGRRIGADEALAIGLVDRLDDDPRAGARALAGEVAASAPLAVRAVRSTLRAGLVARVAEAVEHERAEQVRLMATADFREGTAASLSRRAPVFRGE